MGVETDDDDELAGVLFGRSDGEDEANVSQPPPNNEPTKISKDPTEDEPATLGPDEGRTPCSLKSLVKPSAAGIAPHYLNHLPFRDWCPICQTAKMEEDHHRIINVSQKKRIERADYQQSAWTTKNSTEWLRNGK